MAVGIRKRIVIGVTIVMAALAFFAIATFLISTMQGEPFRMVIKPEKGGATVQFYNPEYGTVSPIYHVSSSVTEKHEIILDSPDIKLPIGTIVFYDITFLPGRYTIRIDDNTFDVMASRIIVNKKSQSWQK